MHTGLSGATPLVDPVEIADAPDVLPVVPVDTVPALVESFG